MAARLPRRLRLGDYVIDVALVSPATLRDVMDDEEGAYDGAWKPALQQGTGK